MLQGLARFHPAMRALSFCLYWVLSAPAWLACWAYFTIGEKWMAHWRIGALAHWRAAWLPPGAATQRLLAPASPGVPSACSTLLASLYTPTLPIHTTASIPWHTPAPAVCLAALIGVGLLLLRQIRLLVRGESYLESLSSTAQHPQQQRSAAGAGAPHHAAAGRLANVRRVFGAGHPLTWLLPAWNVPSAATVARGDSLREKTS